jgi:integrase
MELRDRRLTYRELYLGTAFGSRPGVYEKLAWEPHAEGGHFNLEEALFHRVPPGTRTAANKLAPPVAMPDEVVAELRRWREQDAGNRWLFRTLDGEPLGYDFQAVVFARCMAALGIENVTGHVLRHTCITRLVEKGVPPRVISAVCGISVRMLHRRYDHADDRVLQVLAHGAMVSMLG